MLLSVIGIVVGIDAVAAEEPPRPPGAEFQVDADVSSGSYLIGNVTAINTSAARGFVSIFGDEYDGTSTVNTGGNDVLPNAFVADPGADGEIGVFVGGASSRHVVIDSVAELTKNPATTILSSPRRIKDTRRTGEVIGPGSTTTVAVGRQYASDFALINLTIDRNRGPGFHATFPCSEGYQGTSSINTKGDGGAQAVLNLVKVDENGDICVRSQRAAGGVIVDLLGLIESDAAPFGRVADTRTNGGPLEPGVQRRFVVGEPNSVFIGTVVSTNPSGRGWVAAYTNSGGYDGTSTLNSDGTNSIANLVMMRTDSTGAIYVQSKPGASGLRTDIVIDGTTIAELAPHLRATGKRLLDTRLDAAAAPPLLAPTICSRMWEERPSFMGVNCTASQFLTRVTWTQWGPDTARGIGRYCVTFNGSFLPDGSIDHECVDGVTVELSEPTRIGCGDARPVDVFTKLFFREPGGREQRWEIGELIGC
ncbi:MAG: hypothetical protein AAGA42_07075 [Actinomycetota bacterium]